MKTRETFPGKTYSVHTANGCTVSDDSGWSKEIEAPDGYFTAHGSTVYLSDDEATMREVFKLAPYQKLRLLGVVGGDTLAWLKTLESELAAMLDGSQFELAWLADEKTLVVHTDRVSDELLAAVKATAEAAMPKGTTLVQYNHNMEISWRDINKYAECKTIAEVGAVNPDYKNDLTSDKWWVYNLTSLTRASRLFEGSPIEFFEGDLSSMNDGDGMFITTNIKKFNTPMPSLTTCSGMFLGCRNLETFDCNLDKLEMGGSMFFGAKLVSFKNALPVMKNGFQMFRNNPLEVFESELPVLSNGGYMFQGCKLNKASALRVLNSIPTHVSGEHLLDIGIHVDHKQDEEVLAAIANAESKGWTLTVQWNGTPTSAASVMRFGQIIYAKVDEIEQPDGTTERMLDWGHYVTDETGYETFRSLESAYAYFGLPMPEESS